MDGPLFRPNNLVGPLVRPGRIVGPLVRRATTGESENSVVGPAMSRLPSAGMEGFEPPPRYDRSWRMRSAASSIFGFGLASNSSRSSLTCCW